MSEGFAVGISLAALAVAVLSGVAAWIAMVDVQAFRRSTHNVQFVPVDAAKDEFAKKMASHELEAYDSLQHSYPGKDEQI